MTRLVDHLVSLRTTVVLLVALAVLLLAGLVVPQRAVLGDEAVDAIARSSPAKRFVIDGLGLGGIATSPLFIAVLGLFYVNLVAVLVARTPHTLARIRVSVPTPESLAKWTASARALEGTAKEPLDGSVAILLRGHGFKPYRVSPSSMYAVKHRSAAIGFLVFHASFLLLCAGGVMIWYTRYVGETRAVEGQSIEAKDARVIRMPKLGVAPDVAFSLVKIVPSFEKGEATDLRATLRFRNGSPVDAWVNHPAQEGPANVLVNDIGIAPVLWLQDSRGFGLDRVVVPADRTAPVEVPMAGGVVRVRVAPLVTRSRFPSRGELHDLPLQLVIFERDREVFRGALKEGGAAAFAGGRVVLQEVRYWAGLKIVRERGGAMLILGFVMATAGAIWRLLLHRRDLVVCWEGSRFRLMGHGEWFADRDRRELMSICAAIERFDAQRTSGRVPLQKDATEEVTA